MNDINILDLSGGRRTRLIEYFKKELKGIGKIIVADCSNLAPALYSGDKAYIIPRIDHPEYMNAIKTICTAENINAIFSLIDPELSLLAKYSQAFKEMGITTIVSPYSVCETFLDKYAAARFYQENGYKCAPTYNNFSDFSVALQMNELDFPVFIKPQRGSASLNVNQARNIEEAKIIFKSAEDMIIQEYLHGQELGVDVYVDMISNQVVSIFIKEKIAMRAGETDKARSIKSVKLFKIVADLVIQAGLRGPIDLDIFDVNGEYYISEINPRFGGGYPLAYECGVNFPKYLINNLQGIENNPQIGNYEENVYMMKHDTVTIKKGCELTDSISPLKLSG